MGRKCVVPKSRWAKGLMLAVIVLRLQFGTGLARWRGAIAWAATEEAAKVPASGNRAPAQTPVGQPGPSTTEPATSFAGKRDPFKLPAPPRNAKEEDFRDALPPGKRGLVIGQLRLEGIVREYDGNSTIAVVTNQTNQAYFLRVHDEVYNGVVSGITANAIHFEENRQDNRGRLETREIVLKLGSPGGEGR